jgi:hypothetical protein
MSRIGSSMLGPSPIARRFIDRGNRQFGVPFVSISARVDEVTRTLGFLPPALVGAFRAGLYDMLDHHRRTVLKHVASDFVAGTRAQRMIASRMFGYAKINPNPTTFGDLAAEAFVASREGEGAPIGFDELARFETGGQVSSREAMAIPVGAGLPRKSGPFQNVPLWQQAAVKAKGGLKQFTFVTVKGKTFIIDDRDSTIKRRRKAGEAETSPIVGVLRRGRYQPKKLRFYASADAIRDRHAAKFDRLVSKAITEAGLLELETRNKAGAAAFKAGRQAFQDAVASGVSFREARMARDRMRSRVKSEMLGGGGGGGGGQQGGLF